MNLIAHFKDARNAVHIPAGHTIFQQGNRGTVMYVLIDGLAEILVGGRSVELAQSGALLGEMALLDNEPRSATVVAWTACKLVPIPLEQFDLLVRETPEFARCVMRSTAERLRRMNQRIPVRLVTSNGVRTQIEGRLAA